MREQMRMQIEDERRQYAPAAVEAEAERERAEFAPRQRVISAAALMQRHYEDNPVVADLLDQLESLLIIGPPNIGKSLLALYFAIWLANPTWPLWGKFNAPKPVKTLFIQSENSAKGTQKRLNRMLQAHPELEVNLESIFFAGAECRVSGSFLDPAFLSDIEAMVSETGAGLLVIDPIISFHGAPDENDNSAMRRSLDQLTALQDRTKTAAVVIHHRGKGNSDDLIYAGRGASALPDWVDNQLVLTADKKHPAGQGVLIEVAHPKARNFAKQEPWWLERTADLEFLRVSRPGETKDLDQASAVVAALQKLGGQADKQEDLENAVRVALNCSATSARRAIDAAKARMFIQVTHNETDKRKLVYTLPSQGK